jgi:hypothetical protein
MSTYHDVIRKYLLAGLQRVLNISRLASALSRFRAGRIEESVAPLRSVHNLCGDHYQVACQYVTKASTKSILNSPVWGIESYHLEVK